MDIGILVWLNAYVLPCPIIISAERGGHAVGFLTTIAVSFLVHFNND